MCGGHIIVWVSQHCYCELLSFPGCPLFNLWSLHECQEQVCLLKGVHHYFISVICIPVIIERLKECIYLASLSHEEDGHGPFQCSICWGRCCWCWLLLLQRVCSSSRRLRRASSSASTSTRGTASTTRCTSCLSGSLWLWRWGLSLMSLSTSSSLCYCYTSRHCSSRWCTDR
jgi:hypothetical protein